MRRSLVAIGMAAGLAAMVLLVQSVEDRHSLYAQGSKSKSKGKSKGSIKAIDVRAQRSVDQFVREAGTLAREYENAGQFEKSRKLLESIENVKPGIKGVKEKIQKLTESLLSSNSFEFEIDPSQGWGAPRVRVTKGRKFRLQSAGSYQFIINQKIGPEGFPTEDPKSDMVAGIPCGALMGLIVTNGKPGRPFAVGSGREMSPKDDGLLFVRVNAPPKNKSTGRIQVQISGYARSN